MASSLGQVAVDAVAEVEAGLRLRQAAPEGLRAAAEAVVAWLDSEEGKVAQQLERDLFNKGLWAQWRCECLAAVVAMTIQAWRQALEVSLADWADLQSKAEAQRTMDGLAQGGWTILGGVLRAHLPEQDWQVVKRVGQKCGLVWLSENSGPLGPEWSSLTAQLDALLSDKPVG